MGDGIVSDLTVSIDERHFEDYVLGSVYEYGPVTLSDAEIIEFAEKYDPQPFHTDPDAARGGPFGGLAASGLQSLAVAMQLFVGNFLSTTGSLGSPGLDELRFLLPVRPNDELRLRVTVVEARLSKSKPDRGLVRTKWELINQDNAPVLSLLGLNFIAARN